MKGYRRQDVKAETDVHGFCLSSHQCGGRNLVLSDSRRQVLKASYNLRDWWQVGVDALGEEKFGPDNSGDTIPIIFRNGETFGIQLDTTFKF